MMTTPLTDCTTVPSPAERGVQRGLGAAAMMLLVACLSPASVIAQTPSPGSSDLPVTRKRLIGARLDYHRSDPKLSWSFGEKTFVLTLGGETVPRELVKTLTGRFGHVARIEGTWDLDGDSRILTLLVLQADDEAVRHTARLPISGVGLVRVEFGDYQYNVFPGEAELGEGPSARTSGKDGADPVEARVCVKVLLPMKPLAEGKSPDVESWIARKLRKRRTNDLRAVTEWIQLGEKGTEYVHVWNATLDGTTWGCPVAGRVSEDPTGGKLTVKLVGWTPFGAETDEWSLPAEIGSRRVVVVDTGAGDGTGTAYVAIFVAPGSASVR